MDGDDIDGYDDDDGCDDDDHDDNDDDDVQILKMEFMVISFFIIFNHFDGQFSE